MKHEENKTVQGSFLGLTHLGLTEHLDAVLTDELQQLTVGQAEELIFLGYLGDEDRKKRAACLSIIIKQPDTLDGMFHKSTRYESRIYPHRKVCKRKAASKTFRMFLNVIKPAVTAKSIRFLRSQFSKLVTGFLLMREVTSDMRLSTVASHNAPQALNNLLLKPVRCREPAPSCVCHNCSSRFFLLKGATCNIQLNRLQEELAEP